MLVTKRQGELSGPVQRKLKETMCKSYRDLLVLVCFRLASIICIGHIPFVLTSNLMNFGMMLLDSSVATGRCQLY